MIRLMLCYARSGGTVLNQCLGSLPNATVMSEVNPLGGGWGKEGPESPVTIKEQARSWYNIELTSNDFGTSAFELSTKCKYLIIRDWSFVNFFPLEQNNFNPPNRFLAFEELIKECSVIPFAFVRDSIDVFISRKGDADEFFCSYLNYVLELLQLGVVIFKYEDFCKNPELELQKMCTYLNIPFSVDAVRNYKQFQTVHGDIQYTSRGNKLNTISTLSRQSIPNEAIGLLNRHELMIECNKLLNYPTEY